MRYLAIAVVVGSLPLTSRQPESSPGLPLGLLGLRAIFVRLRHPTSPFIALPFAIFEATLLGTKSRLLACVMAVCIGDRASEELARCAV